MYSVIELPWEFQHFGSQSLTKKNQDNIDKTRKKQDNIDKTRQDKCVLAGWQDRTVPLQINASTR